MGKGKDGLKSFFSFFYSSIIINFFTKLRGMSRQSVICIIKT